MKILLLNPTIRTGEPIIRAERCQSKVISGIWPPIALAYMAAVLKHPTRTIEILDAVVLKMSYSQMLAEILKRAPNWIIVQNTTPTLPDDLRTARFIKQRLPDVHITFFGLHATVRPSEVVAQGWVDTAVLGEPEATILDLATLIDRGETSSYGTVPGLAYQSGSAFNLSPKRELLADLDTLPFPDRSLLPNDSYVIPITQKPFTIVKTSRGCPYSCIFCTSPAFYRTTWRTRSPGRVVEEMVAVHERYGINEFVLHSETFNAQTAWVEELCSLLIARRVGLRWMCNSRADGLTESLVTLMKEAGCWLVTLGIESGNAELLRRCGKRSTPAAARRAIALLKKADLKVIAYFLLGLPGETPLTARQTLQFALDTDPDYAHFYVVTPFPGTALFDYAQNKGYLTSLDWTRYYHGVSDVLSYPQLSADRLTHLSKQFYRRFYFRPRRIVRELTELRTLKDLIGRVIALWDLIRVWLIRR